MSGLLPAALKQSRVVVVVVLDDVFLLPGQYCSPPSIGAKSWPTHCCSPAGSRHSGYMAPALMQVPPLCRIQPLPLPHADGSSIMKRRGGALWSLAERRPPRKPASFLFPS